MLASPDRIRALIDRLRAVEAALRPFAQLDDEGLNRRVAAGMGTAGGVISWEMLDAARAALRSRP